MPGSSSLLPNSEQETLFQASSIGVPVGILFVLIDVVSWVWSMMMFQLVMAPLASVQMKKVDGKPRDVLKVWRPSAKM